MIKYAIPVIFLICMTAYESSADSASSNCGKQFKQKSSTKAPKKPWMERKYFAELLAYFKIATYKQYRGFPRNIFRQEAEKRWGEGFRIPGDPEGAYDMTWWEVTGRSRITIVQFKELISKLGITTIRQFRERDKARLNKEAENMFGEGSRVPTEPMRAYGMKWLEIMGRSRITIVQFRELMLDLGITTARQFRKSDKGDLIKEVERRWGKGFRIPTDPEGAYGEEWPDLMSIKFTTKQNKLTDLESLSLDLPEFIEEYLSETLITELNFNDKEIEKLFDNFQYGMKLLIKKKFRGAFELLSKAGGRLGNLKLKELMEKAEIGLKKHIEELNKTSTYNQNDEAA